MRYELLGDIRLRECGGRAEDQFGAVDGVGDIRCHPRQLNFVSSVRIFQHDPRTRRAMRLGHLWIAPPKPDIVALKREIARGREGTVATTQHRDPHKTSPWAG